MAGASGSSVDAGDLEEEIAEEEKGGEEGGLVASDGEVLSQAASHAECEVGAIEVGEAIGD